MVVDRESDKADHQYRLIEGGKAFVYFFNLLNNPIITVPVCGNIIRWWSYSCTYTFTYIHRVYLSFLLLQALRHVHLICLLINYALNFALLLMFGNTYVVLCYFRKVLNSDIKKTALLSATCNCFGIIVFAIFSTTKKLFVHLFLFIYLTKSITHTHACTQTIMHNVWFSCIRE